MDLRAYYIQAAEAAAPAVHAEDDDNVLELTPKAVLLKLQVQAGTHDVPASRKGSCLSPSGDGNAETGKVVAEGGGTDLTCPECGKAFLSDKAMYGHLRSHPERGYKGATRPAAVAGDKKPMRKVRRKEADELSATIMSAGVAGEKKQREEHELSAKWPLTAKRVRASSARSAASESSSWCSDEEEAAMILLEMASRGTTSKTQQPLPLVHARDAKHQIPDVEQPMLLDHVAQNQMPELMQLMPPDHVACAVVAHRTPDDERQIVQSELSPEVIVESQMPEVKELTELLEIPTKAVVVVVRDKSTPANQQPADPGSGATKLKKGRLLDSENTPGTASPEAANVKPPPARRIPSPASDKKHECLICCKSFPTHQALGGHMAGHNKGGSKHGARHDDPSVVQTMQNILAHRNRNSNAIIIGGTSAAAEGAFAGVFQQGLVIGPGQVGADVAGGGQGVAVASGDQEGAVAGACQERRDVKPPALMSPAPHVCPECNMTFRSGQALGGHKRKHWFPEKQARAALAAASRNFDLNELPGEGEGEKQP